jgi:hypothetical protein
MNTNQKEQQRLLHSGNDSPFGEWLRAGEKRDFWPVFIGVHSCSFVVGLNGYGSAPPAQIAKSLYSGFTSSVGG